MLPKVSDHQVNSAADMPIVIDDRESAERSSNQFSEHDAYQQREKETRYHENASGKDKHNPNSADAMITILLSEFGGTLNRASQFFSAHLQ